MTVRLYSSDDLVTISDNTDEYSLNKFNEYLSHEKHVIEKGDRIVGWYIISPAESSIQSSYIYIYIMKEYRRSGLARRVCSDAVEKMKLSGNSW